MTSLKLDVGADEDGKCRQPVSSPLPTYMNEDSMGTDKLVVVLVGMPARGKSYIAKKLSSYLNWGSHKTEVFNVGQHRRVMTHENQSSEFFDPNNKSAKELREKLATEVLESAIHFLKYEGGQVAIFDATNTTAARRAKVASVCALAGVRYLFIESVCDDKRVLESNFQTKVRNSPDYKNMPYDEAVKDLSQRIANYEKAYEPVTDEENLPYIKLINLNSKVVCYHVFGRLPRTILFYLMSIHIARRPVWLCRAGHCMELDANGEPMMDFQGRRMDTELSAQGWEFAQGLADFIKAHEPPADAWYQKGDLVVFTSMLSRAAQTASLIGVPPQRISALNMMDKGVCDGMSLKQIQQQMPEVQHQFESDPFNFRVPGGESYADVVKRLDTIVIDLERYTKPVLIVSHLSALRVLYAYFSNQPVEKCPFLDVPQHCIVQLTPTQYGWTETRHFPCKAPLIGNRSFSDIEFPRIPITPVQDTSHQFLNSPGFQPSAQAKSKPSSSQPNSARVADLTRSDSKTREGSAIANCSVPAPLPPAASAEKS